MIIKVIRVIRPTMFSWMSDSELVGLLRFLELLRLLGLLGLFGLLGWVGLLELLGLFTCSSDSGWFSFGPEARQLQLWTTVTTTVHYNYCNQEPQLLQLCVMAILQLWVTATTNVNNAISQSYYSYYKCEQRHSRTTATTNVSSAISQSWLQLLQMWATPSLMRLWEPHLQIMPITTVASTRVIPKVPTTICLFPLLQLLWWL